MIQKRVTIDISGIDFDAYATAARHLHILMGKKAPTTRELLNYELTKRVPDWIVDYYLDSTGGGLMNQMEADWFKRVRKAANRFRDRRDKAEAAAQRHEARFAAGRGRRQAQTAGFAGGRALRAVSP